MKKLFLLSLLVMTAFCSMKAQGDRPVVETAPGEEKLYNTQIDAAFYIGGPITLLENLCYRINFDGDKAYIYNLFSVQDPTGEYVICEISDNKIYIPTGFVYRDLGYAEARVMRFFKDSEGEWIMDTDNNPIIWTVSDDGTIREEDEDVMMALVTFYDEFDYLETGVFYDFLLTPTSLPDLELPDSVTDIQSYRRYVNYPFDETWLNTIFDVARDGNDFYFKGLYDYPESMEFNCWVKGSLEGNTITIPNGQLIGVDLRGYFCYNAKTKINMMTGEFIVLDEPVQFTYDEENNRMTTEDWLLSIQGTMPYFYFPEPELSLFELVEAVPAEPTFVMFDDYWYDYFGTVDWVVLIPYEDVNGNFIDPNQITFSLFLDNEEPYVFEPDQYPGLFEPQSVFGFYENNNYIKNTGSEGYQRHIISLTTNSFQKVGIRSYYTVNGVRNESSILWYDRNPTGIEKSTVEKEILNVETYDLLGNRVSDETKGLVVKKITFSDGTVKTTKEMIK